jgi:hypothetical protein
VLQSVDHQWALAVMFIALAVWQSAVALVTRRRIARLALSLDGGQAR